MVNLNKYLQDHIPKFAAENNSELIESLLVLGISSFKSIIEGEIKPSKSIKILKKATSKKKKI